MVQRTGLVVLETNALSSDLLRPMVSSVGLDPTRENPCGFPIICINQYLTYKLLRLVFTKFPTTSAFLWSKSQPGCLLAFSTSTVHIVPGQWRVVWIEIADLQTNGRFKFHVGVYNYVSSKQWNIRWWYWQCDLLVILILWWINFSVSKFMVFVFLAQLKK